MTTATPARRGRPVGTGQGRSPDFEQLHWRLPKHLVIWLRAEAERQRRTVTNMATLLLEQAMQANGSEG